MSGRLLVGVGLLLFGRQLFWLFVAVMGFLVGLDWVAPLLPNSPSWLGLLIAVSIGVLGAVLVWLWQWVAVGIAGFLAGGYLTGHLLQASGMATGSMPGGVFVLGGLVGALLMIAVFDWALILPRRCWTSWLDTESADTARDRRDLKSVPFGAGQ